jgi:murein DD-endopeptidase MepM/ murein hydrolase activator NlpD
MHLFIRLSALTLILVCASAVIYTVPPVHAETVDDIKSQISDHNSKIQAIEAEIAAYQKQLNVLGGQHQTLQTAISSLDVTRKQTASQIDATQNKISASNLKLSELSYEIADKEDIIRLDKAVLAKSFRDIQAAGDATLVEQLLSADSLTEAWITVDATTDLSRSLESHAVDLGAAKVELTQQHATVATTREKLSSLNAELSNQKKSLDVAKAEKAKLLAQTKNQESTYQSLIAKKRAEQKVFEAALAGLENSLKSVGSASIPHVGQGILAWPFTPTFMATCPGKSKALGNNFCITQYFGNTAFATANAQIYNGSGHNAIDIGAPTGTAITSALSGTVMATGNTDAVPGCYSYGKWVVVKHANGLATLYAHLSSIGVAAGQAVSTGSVLGYSGMTGYATGPHLHFGVYASAGVQIMTLKQYRGATTPCANASMPVAPKDAYLNPMSYL